MKKLLKPLSVFLSLNVLSVQLVAATPQNKSLKIHVGYIGEKLENIPEGYQKLVRQKMLGLINQNYYEFNNPTDLSRDYSDAVATVLLHNSSSFKDELTKLSKSADLDYIFVTSLSNISEDDNRIMLKGNVVRYNRKSNDIYQYEILSYAEDLDLHIRAMKTEMIETIPHSIHGISRNRAYILVGIVVVIAFAMSQSFGGLGNFLLGGGDDDKPDPPVGN
ncbi:MAG: hypothetical protein ISR82_01655 [Candidatus Marinimicrobia bacterium]|nr:hypothetical protein [Candidatus Neomarinimicrobiota bacterium]MBL7009912.1 hypothetical protein [Candidatus Neomarinimicrobiota bacterium]MBL7030137.1 hypothetical protein [Candidatus Neomarinimicrobiota bacterium]